MFAKKNPKSPVPVLATKHKDKRANIPTEELRGFVADEEKTPRKILYPRDPSLDPQLVWKGKDEQDTHPLEVPAVPIYIQEKIKPQIIIENLRASPPSPPSDGGEGRGEEEQISLFSDFNGIKFEQLIEFYQHKDGVNWANRMILGDSLLVMTSLAEKEGLKGQVQMIYIDPPYGIKFGSNWQVSTRKRDVKDGKAEDATRQPEQIRAFRDTWKLGIHSYLAYLRDRLTVARELLTESGSVFVQIGDENVHLVRSIMDEVYGSENFVSLITFRTTTNLVGNYLGRNSDYLLWYGKSIEHLKYRQLYVERGFEDDIGGRYSRVELEDGTRRVMTTAERADIALLPKNSRIYRHGDLTSQGSTGTGGFVFEFESCRFNPGDSRHWTTSEEGMRRIKAASRLAAASKNSLCFVRYIDDFPVGEHTNVWSDTQTGAFTDDKVYVVQTNTKVIERCLLMTTDPGDLVLDPTCGSGTTAFVAEQWGRRWITCDTSRVAIALARTRLMAAKFPYYLLADSEEGQRKEMEATGKFVAQTSESAVSRISKSAAATPSKRSADLEIGDTAGLETRATSGGDIKRGFIYKRVPHVTLKSIANNPDIKPGMKRAEIDAAIARHADTELLYDQPYEDNKRIRVTGPFTVESLSPHRFLSADENGDGTISEQEARQHHDFATMILDNLKKSGVQNTRKEERLKFDTLEPFAGTWIHAVGTYTERASEKSAIRNPQSEIGRTRRAAVCIGPEHGTVGPDLVKEAAKEAVQGVGFDILIVCGFAFDPHVSEEAKRYGKLAVMPARMNPDLAMGDELLKKTGAGNLFMVFGEPDVEIRKVGRDSVEPTSKKSHGSAERRPTGEQLIAEIKGVDIYDPTTGEIRNSSTDDIACWFIDTDYNGESFFVRHAYFTGADEPYEKLKRALRADIDESAWSSLYSTVSRPFDKPKTGKIAIKVINHYGDEVLKVYEV
jgi:adenine-specific DNA-methyltransferase